MGQRNKKLKPFISVVIPTYNEEKRVSNLRRIFSYFENKKINTEIIVVNDGSVDKTLKLIRNIVRENTKNEYISTKIISYRKNRGKGYAIKRGMLASNGKYRLFMDIDLSTALSSFSRFEKQMNNHHVVIASRKISGARVLKHQTRLRETLGVHFTKLSQIILQVPVSDFTCGYKMFSEISAKKIFKYQKIERWGFDSEVLFLAKLLGFNILEVPVQWKHNQESKVKFPQDILYSLLELIQIRLKHFKKKY